MSCSCVTPPVFAFTARLSPSSAPRTRFVATESLAATFGEAFEPFVRRIEPDVFSEPGEVADAVFAVCSGLFDALGGQVLTVDRGAGSYENFSRMFVERDRHPLKEESL